MPNLINEFMHAEMKTLVEASPSMIVIDPAKLNSADTLKLRSDLRGIGAKMKVAKVSILNLVVPEAAKPLLDNKCTIGLVLTTDMLGAAKALADLAKENKVSLKGGLMDGKPVTPAELKVLADLPPLDVLRGMFVNILAAPLTGLVRTIAEIEKKKQGGESAPAA
jgi:large subunit ribosomal protein L10